MKKLIPLVALVLLLTSLPALSFAESEKVAPVEAGVVISTPESVDSPQTTVSEFITTSYTLIYTCPVRQQHVTVTWDSGFGPEQLRVLVEILDGNSWVDFGEKYITSKGTSIAFDFDQAYRYRVSVKRVSAGSNGTCDFTILASS